VESREGISVENPHFIPIAPAEGETILHEFLGQHRQRLIARCQGMVAARRAPQATDHEPWHGIPLFLDQLIGALWLEHGSGAAAFASVPIQETIIASDISATAAQHGTELLRKGSTVSQVVHDYGDLCQAITDLAVEQGATVSAEEFRTLNRCLDNAIADPSPSSDASVMSSCRSNSRRPRTSAWAFSRTSSAT
jgi:hypothetical protein